AMMQCRSGISSIYVFIKCKSQMIDQSNRLFVCIYKHVFAYFFVLFFFPIPTFQTFFPILSFMMRDGDKIIENLRRILFEENEEPTPTLTPTSTSTSILIVKPKKRILQRTIF